MDKPIEKTELYELIDLQSAHITQGTNGINKTEWEVKKNITEESLYILPKRFSEKEVFLVMNFAKKYELIAFNAGIKFQKGKQNEVLTEQIKNLKQAVSNLAEENERLADVLDKLTSK